MALAHPHTRALVGLTNVDTFAMVTRAIFGAFIQFNLAPFPPVSVVAGTDTAGAALSSATASVGACRHFARVSHPTLLARASAVGTTCTVPFPGAHLWKSSRRVFLAPVTFCNGTAFGRTVVAAPHLPGKRWNGGRFHELARANARLEVANAVLHMSLRAVTSMVPNVARAHASLALSVVVALVFARWVLTQPPSPTAKAGALSGDAHPVFGAVLRAQARVAVGTAPSGQALDRIVTIIEQNSVDDSPHPAVFAGPTRVACARALFRARAVAAALVWARADTAAVARPSTTTVALARLQIAGAVSRALSSRALPSRAVVHAASFSAEHVVTTARAVQARPVAPTSRRTRPPVAIETQARAPSGVACADAVGTVAGTMPRAHVRAVLLLARVAPPAFEALTLALVRVARAVARAFVFVVPLATRGAVDTCAAFAKKELFAAAHVRMMAVVVVGDTGRRVDTGPPAVAVFGAHETVAGKPFESGRACAGPVLARAVRLAPGGARLVITGHALPADVAVAREVHALAVFRAVIGAFLLGAVLALKSGAAHARAIGAGQVVARALQPVISERAGRRPAPVPCPSLIALAPRLDTGGHVGAAVDGHVAAALAMACAVLGAHGRAAIFAGPMLEAFALARGVVAEAVRRAVLRAKRVLAVCAKVRFVACTFAFLLHAGAP